MGCVCQRASGEGPRPAAIGSCGAEQRRAVVDAHCAAGYRRAGQRQSVVIGDAVANRAAVGRV